MLKKIFTLFVVAVTFATQINAQSITVTIAGSTSGSPLTVTAVKTDISCNGASNGTVTGTAAGGNGGFGYTITPAVNNTGATSGIYTGLPAGSYTVTASSTGGCTATSSSVTVTEPTPLTASISSQTNVLCFGGTTGSVTVAGSGSNGGYTYAIGAGSFGSSGTFSGLAAGNYTVTVKSGTCTTTQAVSITQPTAILALTPATQTVQIACGATTATATVTASGGTGAYTYAWSSGGSTAATSSVLTAGSYTVTVTDANLCTANASATITAPNATLSATVTPTQILCNTLSPGATGSTTGSVAVTAVLPNSAVPSYVWSNTGTGSTVVTAQTIATVSSLAAGTYTVSVSAPGYCPVSYPSTINAAPTQVSATFTKADDGCETNLGTVTLTGTGGSGSNYQMKWVSATENPVTNPHHPAATGTPAISTFTTAGATGSFSNLTGGYDYKFVIKDGNGCTTQ